MKYLKLIISYFVELTRPPVGYCYSVFLLAAGMYCMTKTVKISSNPSIG